MNMNDIKVAVIMGSKSDLVIMNECMKVLDELKIPYETKILSAHRSPEDTMEYARSASEKGIEVIIAGAGWAAHLSGFIASQTLLPVIGVPIDSSPLSGVDALLSTLQMPPPVPVATVAIGKGGAKNAAILAARILSLKYPEIVSRLKDYMERYRGRSTQSN